MANLLLFILLKSKVNVWRFVMVRILFYCSLHSNQKIETLKESIKHLKYVSHLDGCESIDALSSFLGLGHSTKLYDVIILYVSSGKEIDSLISLYHFMEHSDLILILPDIEKSLFRKAILLYPRYITTLIDYFDHLEIVIRNIVNRSYQRQTKAVDCS